MLVDPKVYLIGYTDVDMNALWAYLNDTGQQDFMTSVKGAQQAGLSNGEILCSLYAKLCYKSLTVGKNANITGVRDITDNIKATILQAHGSVFEHFNLNFIATNVSRVFTHELVRHRAGWAFSQTSGRYCRLDKIDFVFDPILGPVKSRIESLLDDMEHEIYCIECKLGMRKAPSRYPDAHFTLYTSEDCVIQLEYGEKVTSQDVKWVPNNNMPMDLKKKLTSAIRRVAPNGQSNEIGFTVNIRSLRHFIQLRSSRHAEWEIRYITHQMVEILKNKYPTLFFDAKMELVNELWEVSGMKTQPYERSTE
jgi:thymidylate synthase (FAD)